MLAVRRRYTTWHTTSTDLGKLGGIGMRIYFTILMVLSFSFFVMGPSFALCTLRY